MDRVLQKSVFYLFLFILFYWLYALMLMPGPGFDGVSMIAENKELAKHFYHLFLVFLISIFPFTTVLYLDLGFYRALKNPESLYENVFLKKHLRNFNTSQHLKEVECKRKFLLQISLTVSIWSIALLLCGWWSIYIVFNNV